MSNMKKDNEELIEYLTNSSDYVDAYKINDAVKNDIEYERIELEREKLEVEKFKIEQESADKKKERRQNLIYKVGDIGVKLLTCGVVIASLAIGNKADKEEYSRTSTVGKKGDKMAEDLFRNIR